jgi:NADH-quinone oxidoreductase subunit N
MWVPDVYEGSPTAVTLFIASAPKIAAFAMAIRLLVDGMQPLVADWQGMLIILSVLSMAAGNLIAISQTNIKRMLAYSTIAHVGFLLLGILSGTQSGYAGSMFYIIVYALMSMGSFGMVILLGRSGHEADKLDDFKGLARRSQWFAFVMMVLMFSMAGVPPFIGFWAKWFVIKEVIAADQVWLAALAVVFSVIGAYYYLRIVKLMYFDDADTTIALKGSKEMRLVLSLNGLAILLLGLVPGALMAVCLRAME